MRPGLVAGFLLNPDQLFAQDEKDRVDSLLQWLVVADSPTLRLQCGDGLHQRLAANVCFTHTCYYINSRACTRTRNGRSGRMESAGNED